MSSRIHECLKCQEKWYCQGCDSSEIQTICDYCELMQEKQYTVTNKKKMYKALYGWVRPDGSYESIEETNMYFSTEEEAFKQMAYYPSGEKIKYWHEATPNGQMKLIRLLTEYPVEV